MTDISRHVRILPGAARTGLAALVLGLCNAAGATDFAVAAPPIEVNAYGTLGLTRSLASNVKYRDMDSSDVVAGNAWTGHLDNRLGVQARLNIASEWAAVSQLLIQRNGADEVRGQFPWAYIDWQPNNHWNIRFGRFRQALFLTTESFDVGYAQPWARPPAELYSIAGEMTSVDGIQLRHRMPLWGNFVGTTTFHAGVAEIHRPRYETRNPRNLGLSFGLSDNHLTVQASLIHADMQMRAAGIERTVGLIRAQNPPVANEYDVANVKGELYGALGVRYERDNWLLMSEVGATRLRRLSLTDRVGWYVTAGRQFGAWMPYVTYAENRTQSPISESRLAGAAATAVRALLDRRDTNQKTWSLGLRWDISDGLDIKLQLDRVRPNTYGLQPGPLPDGRGHFNVLSVVMDWTY